MARQAFDDLTPAALAVVSLAIVVAIGAVVLANMQPASYDTVTQGTESFSPSTPFPTNITVSVASDNDFVQVVEDSETVVFYDSSAGTNTTLTADTDYVPYYGEGTFDLQNTTTTESYESGTDNIFVDGYDYEREGTAYSVLGTGISALQTMADFFTVIVVVVVATVLFLLLRVMRRSSGGMTA